MLAVDSRVADNWLAFYLSIVFYKELSPSLAIKVIESNVIVSPPCLDIKENTVIELANITTSKKFKGNWDSLEAKYKINRYTILKLVRKYIKNDKEINVQNLHNTRITRPSKEDIDERLMDNSKKKRKIEALWNNFSVGNEITARYTDPCNYKNTLTTEGKIIAKTDHFITIQDNEKSWTRLTVHKKDLLDECVKIAH